MVFPRISTDQAKVWKGPDTSYCLSVSFSVISVIDVMWGISSYCMPQSDTLQ